MGFRCMAFGLCIFGRVVLTTGAQGMLVDACFQL